MFIFLVPIEGKMYKTCFRWFEDVGRKPIDALVYRVDGIKEIGDKRKKK